MAGGSELWVHIEAGNAEVSVSRHCHSCHRWLFGPTSGAHGSALSYKQACPTLAGGCSAPLVLPALPRLSLAPSKVRTAVKLCVPEGRGGPPSRPVSWGLHPLPTVLLSSGHGAGPVPECRSVQEHVTSCAVSGMWSCSSDDRGCGWPGGCLPSPSPKELHGFRWVWLVLAEG